MRKKQPALSAAHCQVLQQPFYQFAQMKQFAPESIEGVKAQYRAAWTDWRDFVLAVQAALAAQGIDCIFLIAPTTTPERIAAIAEKASGFIYYVSLKGVTGSARLDTEAVARQIALLRQYTDLPIGVGFGIRDAQSAAQIAQVADAVIVGSRIVQEIEKQPAQAVRAVADLVRELKAAV